LSDDQPCNSENCNVSEEYEECVDEDKELLVVTEDDLYVLELFESLSEELASFAMDVIANEIYGGG